MPHVRPDPAGMTVSDAVLFNESVIEHFGICDCGAWGGQCDAAGARQCGQGHGRAMWALMKPRQVQPAAASPGAACCITITDGHCWWCWWCQCCCCSPERLTYGLACFTISSHSSARHSASEESAHHKVPSCCRSAHQCWPHQHSALQFIGCRAVG